jgi:hypothetical protein
MLVIVAAAVGLVFFAGFTVGAAVALSIAARIVVKNQGPSSGNNPPKT